MVDFMRVPRPAASTTAVVRPVSELTVDAVGSGLGGFMRGVGRTIKSEINRERIRRIKDLLTNTDYKLSTIADQVGFAHAEYMSVMFKEAVGMTPGAYRKKYSERPS